MQAELYSQAAVAVSPVVAVSQAVDVSENPVQLEA